MAVIEWIRFIIGTLFLLAGLAMFLLEIIGVFRFKYVLNRMHAAAIGDTFGIGLCFVGLIIMSGLTFTSLKLFFVIVFLWFSSPASSHLIARLEVTTDEEGEKHYKRVFLNSGHSDHQHSDLESSDRKNHFQNNSNQQDNLNQQDNPNQEESNHKEFVHKEEEISNHVKTERQVDR